MIISGHLLHDRSSRAAVSSSTAARIADLEHPPAVPRRLDRREVDHWAASPQIGPEGCRRGAPAATIGT